jgi:hypothetical protein
MIVRNKLCDRASEVALAERHDAVQTFFFDRPHKTLCAGVRIRCTLGRQHEALVHE